ncbi:MAG: hypothetical protein ABSF70_11160 [Terracidiphilus sp.]|jgi:hypothetical protein
MTTTITPAAVTHTYHGTASVGDFLDITVNSTALTIAYSNLSNGQSGTVPYTVNANGSYAINDPTGNLLSAYEVPGYAMMIQSAKSGLSQNTPALITAVESGPITLSTFANNSYNYMSFRTSFGGLEIGSVSIGSTSGTNTNYWPYGNTNSAETGGAFGGGTMDFSGLAENASGTYMSGSVGGAGGGTDYIFGTTGGFFIVDSPNGSIIGLQKAATPNFDPSVAGTYNGIYYEKLNANNSGSTETGTPSTGQATVVITAAAGITVTDSNNNTIINATLTPVASSSNLYGTGSDGKLTDPCYGLFTFHTVTPTFEHDVFVTFVGNSVVFSKYSVNLPWNENTGTYTYWYGVGLK